MNITSTPLRKLLLLTLASASLLLGHTAPAQANIFSSVEGVWGLGAGYRDSNYLNAQGRVSPLVLVFGSWGPIFIDGNRFGYHFYEGRTWFADVAVNLRPQQFRIESESPDLAGTSAREPALELGFQFGAHLGGGIKAQLAAFHDVSGRHNSQEFELAFYRLTKFDNDAQLKTFIAAQYQTAELVDYYFGQPSDGPRGGYVGKATNAFELEVIYIYPIHSISIITGTRLFQYGSAVTDSPITDGALNQQYFLGVGYNF